MVSRIRNSHPLFEQPERIYCRHSRTDQRDRDERGECSEIAHHIAEKSRDDQEKTSQYKHLSAQPVGAVPVFRAVQGPRNADAYRVVLLQFRHIVPEDDEEQADQDGDYNAYIGFHAEGDGVGHAVHQYGHDRKDP